MNGKCHSITELFFLFFLSEGEGEMHMQWKMQRAGWVLGLGASQFYGMWVVL
jgi:hypothetical protein